MAAALLFRRDATFALLGMSPPADLLTLHLFVVFVVLFCAGYFWVGRDPTGNYALVGLGAAGKVAVFGVLLGHALAHRIPYAPAALGAGDLVFALLFVSFLLRRLRRDGVPLASVLAFEARNDPIGGQSDRARAGARWRRKAKASRRRVSMGEPSQ